MSRDLKVKNEEGFSRCGWCGAQIRQRKLPAQERNCASEGRGRVKKTVTQKS